MLHFLTEHGLSLCSLGGESGTVRVLAHLLWIPAAKEEGNGYQATDDEGKNQKALPPAYRFDEVVHQRKKHYGAYGVARGSNALGQALPSYEPARQNGGHGQKQKRFPQPDDDAEVEDVGPEAVHGAQQPQPHHHRQCSQRNSDTEPKLIEQIDADGREDDLKKPAKGIPQGPVSAAPAQLLRHGRVEGGESYANGPSQGKDQD